MKKKKEKVEKSVGQCGSSSFIAHFSQRRESIDSIYLNLSNVNKKNQLD